MKAGIVYALCLVIALLVFIILIQHRQMSSLHNDVMRMGADSRALHSLMYRDDITNASALKDMHRLERENSELRDELNRLQNESRTNKKSSSTTGAVSESRPF